MEPRGNSRTLHKGFPPVATGKMTGMTDSVHVFPEPCRYYSKVTLFSKKTKVKFTEKKKKN